MVGSSSAKCEMGGEKLELNLKIVFFKFLYDYLEKSNVENMSLQAKGL